MSAEAWFWLIVNVVLVVACIRSIRDVRAMMNDATTFTSKFVESREGSHANDQESR
jgi:hypothetical protein